jgi:hypothetical protein
MLLFPPEWVPTAPYLALPSLTAVLREAGHHVVQRDINIEMYDHFFTMEFLIWVKARQTMQLKALEAKELRGELTGAGALIREIAWNRGYAVVTFPPNARADAQGSTTRPGTRSSTRTS